MPPFIPSHFHSTLWLPAASDPQPIQPDLCGRQLPGPQGRTGLRRFHKECVELWESLPPESKLHPETWAYNHIVMSYVKDGMGILRWPKKESDLKRRIKDIFLQCARLRASCLTEA